MLTWPRPAGERSDHPGDDDHLNDYWGDHLAEVETALGVFAAQISRREKILVSCRDEAHRAHVGALLSAAGADMDAACLYLAPSNDIWARDHGPITVFEGDVPVLLDFTFNGWGGKYPAALDDHLTRTLHDQGAFGETPLRSHDFVLEGGSIDSDGAGTLLTTSACLLTPGRNTGWSREDITLYLQRTLGVTRVLWLEHGWLAGDDTDSHIDMLARFCDARTIAYTVCEDRSDEHYAPLAAMAAELTALRDSDGRPYTLIPLPIPAPKRDDSGARLPASYANFLIINGAVLVPTYDDDNDALAIERLRHAFPQREIIAIPALALIRQYGSLHCATMQLPHGIAVRGVAV